MNVNNFRITTFQEVPVSFAAQAFKWGCEQDWLHPSNTNQRFLSRTVGYFILRPALRFIYAIAVSILISPLGIIYHSGAAFYSAFSNKQRGVEHLKAAWTDTFAFIFFGSIPVGALDFASGGFWKSRDREGGYDTKKGALYVTGSLFPSTLVKDEDNLDGTPIRCDVYVHRQLLATRL